VTAVVVSNDQMTLGTLLVAEERGLRVPGDLSIVSFDDTPSMRHANPPVTAIVQPIAAVSARAVQLIIEQRRTGHAPVDPVVIPAEMVFRGTTGPVPEPS